MDQVGVEEDKDGWVLNGELMDVDWLWWDDWLAWGAGKKSILFVCLDFSFFFFFAFLFVSVHASGILM